MSKLLLLAAGVLVVAALAYWFGLADVAATLRRASPAGLAVYVGLTAAVVLGYSARWCLMTRAVGAPMVLSRCVAARLAGDAVGTLVPSARLAGDPVRVALARRAGAPTTAATAGVAVDRLLELIGNTLAVLTYGGVFALHRELGAALPLAMTVTLVLLLSALLAPMVVVRRGGRLLAPLYGPRLRGALPRLAAWFDGLQQVDEHLMRFFRAHPRTFVLGVLAAACTEALIVLQYHVLMSAFGIALELPTLLLVLLGGGLARAVPLPGGLGALEATQTILVGAASGQPDLGFVVGVIVRLHETLLTVVGLVALARQGFSLARLPLPAAIQPADS